MFEIFIWSFNLKLSKAKFDIKTLNLITKRNFGKIK